MVLLQQTQLAPCALETDGTNDGHAMQRPRRIQTDAKSTSESVLASDCFVGELSHRCFEPEPTVSPGLAALSACVTPVANLVVLSSATLCPGTYTIGDPEGDGVIQ